MTSTVTAATGGGRIMKTDGGPHPADFWAQVTAEQICPIDEKMTGERRYAAMELQAKIGRILHPHHAKVQDEERAKLAADPDHHKKPLNPEPYLDEAMTDIQGAAKGTPWEKHLTFGFSKPAWLDEYLKEVDRLGADNYALHHDPLTPEQQAEWDGWQRQEIIRQEVGRHFATSQDIEKSYHRQAAA